MDITLSPRLERFVAFLVEAGRVSSADAALEEAFRAFEDNDPWFLNLRSKIDEGARAIESGHATTCDAASLKQLFEEIKLEGRRRLEKNQALAS